MNIIKISSAELLQENEIDINEKNPFISSDFCHYTTLDSADKILKDNCFWMSKISETNDKNERKRYQNESDTFLLCFCCSKTEQIPMWYLYSGINGKGVRLRFTAAKMRDFIRGIKTVNPIYLSENDNSENEHQELTIDEDFQLEYGWVYYQKYKNKETVKYRNSLYVINDVNKFEEGTGSSGKNFFIKDYEWNYEKEFRIIIKLKDSEKLKNLKKPPDKIEIKLDQKMIKLMFGPERPSDKEILEKGGLKKFLLSSSQQSKLNISMGLINKSIDDFVNYIKNECNNEIKSDDYKQLCNAIKKSKNCSK